jgi:hypothetical protein
LKTENKFRNLKKLIKTFSCQPSLASSIVAKLNESCVVVVVVIIVEVVVVVLTMI